VVPPEYYDIALRDFGLFIAALALGRLALSYRSETSLVRRPAAATRLRTTTS
jgi:hypothetical protein